MPFSHLADRVCLKGVGEDLRGFGVVCIGRTAGLVGFHHGDFIIGLGDLVLVGADRHRLPGRVWDASTGVG